MKLKQCQVVFALQQNVHFIQNKTKTHQDIVVFTALIVEFGRNIFKSLFSRYQLLNEYLSGRENSSHSTVT